MEAGLALAIVGTIDLCFKYGKKLVETCVAFKGAETEINERILCVESYWKRTRMQLEFVKRVWEGLDEEHQRIQMQILEVLNSKLSLIISKFEKLSTKGEIKRLNYIRTKKHLDESIEDLASWQTMFDPSWYLILKVSSPFVDQELSRNGSEVSSFTSAERLRDALKEQSLQSVSIFLPKDGLDAARIREISFTSAKCMQRAGSDKWFVIDRIQCDTAVDIGSLTRDVRDLARKLKCVDSLTFGILQCHGVVRIVEPGSKRPSSFDFVFQIPRGLSYEPRSLRSYLSSNVNLTLTIRFELAKQMAKSIAYVHTLGFVHKNVCPETVLGFHNSESESDLFFLVGFESIRMADGQTLRLGDSTWAKNLYRHPHRQGLHPEDTYIMQHDIYSLGVCLLEVGLWKSFLLYEAGTIAPLPSPALGIASDGPEFEQPALMKERLIALAKRHLPKQMGERYKKVVVNCLTCLDDDNADFGDQSEFEDLDGVLVGVKYIEKILLKLDEILV
ncbi:MAG: hypothetical protein Q9190_001109 [Brigantiaea leucoxantha]